MWQEIWPPGSMMLGLRARQSEVSFISHHYIELFSFLDRLLVFQLTSYISSNSGS